MSWMNDDLEFDRLTKSGSEDGEQMALMAWAARQIFNNNFPQLQNLYAVPNGGDRSPAVGAKLKATGVKPGVPDLCLDCGHAGKFGLRIELKKSKANGGGKASTVQLEWRDRLWNENYGWALCFGWREARDCIVQYLTAPKTEIRRPGDGEYDD